MMCVRALSALGVYAVEMYFIPRYVMLYCVYNTHVYTIVHMNAYANVRSHVLRRKLWVSLKLRAILTQVMRAHTYV